MNSVYVQVLLIVECKLKISHLAVGKVKWGDIKTLMSFQSKFILEQEASTWSITLALRFSALHRAVGIEYSYCTRVEVQYNRSKP
jgi:hypothetical protein